MIGKTLDEKYRIERLLGSGGMGSVYGAADLRSGREVAVKIIHAHLPGQSTANVQRFAREAQAAGSVDTDHIVRCLDAGTDAETQSPYMVLELLAGEDLQRVLRRLGPIQADLALRVTAQACLGLSKAHEAGIIHRDIKPANIFLAKHGEGERLVKLLDFGIAKIRRDAKDEGGASTLTQTGSILGSPLYMSPEQARSVKHVDQRADLWSIGIVLYQALAGRTPFNHISGLGDLLIALSSEAPPPVQQFAPWVTPEIAALLDRTLRIDPRERFQTAAEMFDALTVMLPDGIAIHETMLVALPEESRVRTASTFFRRIDTAHHPVARAPAVAAATAPEATTATLADVSPDDSQNAARVVTGNTNPPGQPTHNAMSSTSPSVSVEATPDTRKPFPRATVLIAAACLALGGAAVYFLIPRAAGGPAAEPVPNAVPAASSSSSEPSPRVEPAPASAAPQAPSAAASASATSDVAPGATASTVVPRVSGPALSAAPSARPKASATPSATASAAPAATPAPSNTFTDFGDRK